MLGFVFAVAGYARSQGKSPITFGPTDLVCCRTLQGHTGKVRVLSFSECISKSFVHVIFWTSCSGLHYSVGIVWLCLLFFGNIQDLALSGFQPKHFKLG